MNTIETHTIRSLQLIARRIRRELATLEPEGFLASQLTQRRVAALLEMLGALADKMPDSVRHAHPDIPWEALGELGERFGDNFFGVDPEILFMTATQEIPGLIRTLDHGPDLGLDQPREG